MTGYASIAILIPVSPAQARFAARTFWGPSFETLLIQPQIGLQPRDTLPGFCYSIIMFLNGFGQISNCLFQIRNTLTINGDLIGQFLLQLPYLSHVAMHNICMIKIVVCSNKSQQCYNCSNYFYYAYPHLRIINVLLMAIYSFVHNIFKSIFVIGQVFAQFPCLTIPIAHPANIGDNRHKRHLNCLRHFRCNYILRGSFELRPCSRYCTLNALFDNLLNIYAVNWGTHCSTLRFSNALKAFNVPLTEMQPSVVLA